jgi:hypothetical protein
MKIWRRTAHIRNEENLGEMKVEPVGEKLRRKNKLNWLRRVERMNSNRMTKLMLNYRPKERRRLGRP